MVVRTARGEEWMQGLVEVGLTEVGLIEVRPGEQSPVAMKLLEKLSTVSRRRWPTDAVDEVAARPGLLPVVQ